MPSSPCLSVHLSVRGADMTTTTISNTVQVKRCLFRSSAGLSLSWLFPLNPSRAWLTHHQSQRPYYLFLFSELPFVSNIPRHVSGGRPLRLDLFERSQRPTTDSRLPRNKANMLACRVWPASLPRLHTQSAATIYEEATRVPRDAWKRDAFFYLSLLLNYLLCR